MTGIRIQGLKEAGAFLITTVLSCGPSQLFGCIKLIVDSGLILANHVKKHKIHSNIQKIENDWDNFLTSTKASLIASKLGIENDELTEETALNYFNAKNWKTEANIKKLSRSIAADACAMIPLVGAHISWRVHTDYQGKSFTPILSRGVEQLLEHSKRDASRLIFLGRRLKKNNSIEERGEYIDVSTSTKNRKIQIFDHSAWRADHTLEFHPEGATVVLFHHNMGGAEEIADSARFYRKKGYNTLTVTFGGYQGSPGVTTSEKSMYQDIEAVKQYLSDRGVTEVAYHGISLGTGAAMQAAVGDTLVDNLRTLFVVLDQPYASAAHVGGNAAGPLGTGALTVACPIGLDVELPGGLWTKTDGLDNLRKAALLSEENIPLFCVGRENDSLMGRKKINDVYTENFAQDVIAARYGNDPEGMENLITLPGGHGINILKKINKDFSDEEPENAILERLIPSNLTEE